MTKFFEADQKNSKLEKEKEADARRIADLEYALSAQVELLKSEVIRLEKKLDEVTSAGSVVGLSKKYDFDR